MNHGEQRTNTICSFIVGFYLLPRIEILVRGKQRTIFVIYTIAYHHKSIVFKQFRNISAITHRKLSIGIHDGSFFLYCTLKLQHHHWQPIDVDYPIGYSSLITFYLQLVYYSEDIIVDIVEVYRLNIQVGLGQIFSVYEETLCYKSICIYIIVVQRTATVCRKFGSYSLYVERRYIVIGITTTQIHSQIIAKQHIALLLMHLLAVGIYVSLLLKQFHYSHLKGMFVEVCHNYYLLFL